MSTLKYGGSWGIGRCGPACRLELSLIKLGERWEPQCVLAEAHPEDKGGDGRINFWRRELSTPGEEH